MALPLPIKQVSVAPTGDFSWTLFLSTANFGGPIAFFIPNTWSKLSETYPTIIGRGLDARPVNMAGGAMEINSVPYFEAQDATGTTYTRIPQIQFPVDATGMTKLMQGVRQYSASAIYEPLKAALASGGPIPTVFDVTAQSSVAGTYQGQGIMLSQGFSPNYKISGLNTVFAATASQYKGESFFALQWYPGQAVGHFPEYFKLSGGSLIPVDVSEVPIETNLQSQVFRSGSAGKAYEVPTAYNESWSHWALSKLYTRKLSDGSTVSYRWYRFVDQPALQQLMLSAEEKEILQNIVVKLHQAWAVPKSFMPAQKSGKLIALDSGLFVTPPVGLEYGYVPIVVKQSL